MFRYLLLPSNLACHEPGALSYHQGLWALWLGAGTVTCQPTTPTRVCVLSDPGLAQIELFPDLGWICQKLMDSFTCACRESLCS